MRHPRRRIGFGKALGQQRQRRPEIGDGGEVPPHGAEPVQNFICCLREQEIRGAGRERASATPPLQIAIEDQNIVCCHANLLAHRFAANPANFLARLPTSFMLTP